MGMLTQSPVKVYCSMQVLPGCNILSPSKKGCLFVSI